MLNRIHPIFLWSTLGLIFLAFLSWYPSQRTDITMANKAAIIVPALKKHSATVIMAHGLGDR